MPSSSKLFKFVVSGSDVTMYREKDAGFELKSLDSGETLTFDPTTGDVTLKEAHTDHFEVTVFHQTADSGDDASLYVKGGESWTTLDGTLIIQDDYDHDGNDDDTIGGSEGNDTHHGGRGNDHVSGGLGDDDLFGEDGSDDLGGGAGDDSLHGGHGGDHMQGGDGDDLIDGGSGADDETGDIGDDHLSGGSGDDTLHGNSGHDVLKGGSDDDTLDGGSGADELHGGSGNDDESGDIGDDHLNGNAGDDTLHGDDGNDDVRGGGGIDDVHGGSGDDRLLGGDGDDHLTGDDGKDVLNGGLGADTFVFANGDFAGTTVETADRIVSFSHAQGDTIDLAGVDANTTLDGDQAFSFIGTEAFGNHAGELRFETVDSHTLLTGDTDGNGVADFAIRIDPVATLEVTDFVL